MNAASKIEMRLADTEAWLLENHPECGSDQRHLDEGTPERAYWHHGYMMACRDILKLLGRQVGHG